MYVDKFGYKMTFSLDFIGFEVEEKYFKRFDNGYGVSVIRSHFSYGGDEGLYEVALLDSNNTIIYNSLFNNDVLGFLDEDEVSNILSSVEAM